MIGDDDKLIDIKDFLKILENKSNWLEFSNTEEKYVIFLQ